MPIPNARPAVTRGWYLRCSARPTPGVRLEQAISAGECPEQPDQVDDVVAHRALLRARLDLLAGAG